MVSSSMGWRKGSVEKLNILVVNDAIMDVMMGECVRNFSGDVSTIGDDTNCHYKSWYSYLAYYSNIARMHSMHT